MRGESPINNFSFLYKYKLIISILVIFLLIGTVSAAAPVSVFSGNTTLGVPPSSVLFTDASTNSPTGWAWFFGDESYNQSWTQMNSSSGWSGRSRATSVGLPDGSIVIMGGYISSGGVTYNDTWRSTNNGVTWTRMNASSGWATRQLSTSVVLSDGSIVIMGGTDGLSNFNDTWRSTNNGTTWTRMNASSGWLARYGPSAVVSSDGSIILTGGVTSTTYMNDTWRSIDNGATWTRINASSIWAGRYLHRAVTMTDGSIILTGGVGPVGAFSDVWRSTDKGVTWMRMNSSAAFGTRYSFALNAMPDNSIILMGGQSSGQKNDVWRSNNSGIIWTLVNASAGWSARWELTSATLSNGSVVVLGGYDGTYKNDTWIFNPAGSSAQNPVHTYPLGFYSVSLQVFNTGGFNNTVKNTYISVVPAIANFINNLNGGGSPLTIQFTDKTLGLPTNWKWLFGDESWSPALWTQQSASSGWSKRYGDTAVSLPDGSIVLMGGSDSVTYLNDTWRSVDNGVTWTNITGSPGWMARLGLTSVSLSDGSIVIMGGYDIYANNKNDTWKSTDNGVTWILMNASSGWQSRMWHNSVAMTDGSIVLTGGFNATSGIYYNDTWRSTDKGVTWTLMNSSSGWTPRIAQTSAGMPDGSIILFGGADNTGLGVRNDTWRSTNNGATWTLMNASSGIIAGHVGTGVALFDNSMVYMTGMNYVGAAAQPRNETWRTADGGATWTQLNASSGWQARWHMNSVAMADGSVIVMSGYPNGTPLLNDTWRFVPPIASTSQNPSHTYTLGTYTAALRVYNASGFSSYRQSQPTVVYNQPVSNFTGVTVGAIPFNDLFTDRSSNVTGYSWFFGDEPYTQAWVKQNLAGPQRYYNNLIALPNGNIVEMGGIYGAFFWNDVWASPDKGVTWTEINSSSGWSPRALMSSVSLPDGSIVLMGGTPDYSIAYGDVWKSIDGGYTWALINSSPGWIGRYGQSSVALPDNSIIIMGGQNGSSLQDVWRSTDGGYTWAQQTANVGVIATLLRGNMGVLPDGNILWNDGTNVITSSDNGVTWVLRNAGTGGQVRYNPAGVAMPDNSYLMFAGNDGVGGYPTSVWRSTDDGVSWTQINASSGWSGRLGGQIGVALPDGSVLLGMGAGSSYYRDTWRFQPSGSVIQTPSHIYTSKGNYSVSLLASSVNNYNTTWRLNYTQVYNQSFSNFISNVTSGALPLPVQFNATSTNSTGWAWFFGDEPYTQAWIQQNASAGWAARQNFAAVTLPDGSIVIMGGAINPAGYLYTNDTWRSTDKGVTWVQQNASSGWGKRYGHAATVISNGSIILTGGYDASVGSMNDVWMSSDKGSTWVRVNASAGWAARTTHSIVTAPDGTLIIAGGFTGVSWSNDVWNSVNNGSTWTQVNSSPGWVGRAYPLTVVATDGSTIVMGGNQAGPIYQGDVWRSTNNGLTWTQQNASTGWARSSHTGVAMFDGSILVMGGYNGLPKNDMWRSTDKGVTWTQVNASAGWFARESLTSTVLPDGSVLILGGSVSNDVWRMQPVGSSVQNATHTYTSMQRYNVSLVSSNYASYNNTQKIQYIDVGVLPVSSFSASESSGFNGYITQYIQFTNTSSNAPTTWNWSFRDVAGNNTEVWFSQAQNILYSFSTVGNYTIRLNVSNSYGYNISPDDYWINLSNPIAPPIAQFSGTPVIGPPPLSVSFTDASSFATGWAWFFGDESYNQSWYQINASSGWVGRYQHSTIALHDAEILIMGGTNGTRMNDTWKSTDYGKTWTIVNSSSGWEKRQDHATVLMPDGSIVLMGGYNGSDSKNDTWRSTDEGLTWVLQNASSGWLPRFGLTAVAAQNPSNTIVIMGGTNGTRMNDVWKSTDYGVTWTLMNSNPGWSTRFDFGSVITQDSNIVLMGGYGGGSVYYNDVWKSTDYGATWTQQTAVAPWIGRTRFTTARMPDNSIVLMGGINNLAPSIGNDVWRSTDKGITWTQINASAGWSIRNGLSSVIMPNCSIMIFGGNDGLYLNDTWLFNPVTETTQNPSHVFMNSGYYDISMRAYNFNGYNTTVKPLYITVIGATAAFNITPNPAQLGTSIVFVDMSSNGPTTWNWSFGDGNYSSNQNTTHIYPTIGDFTVKLNASNIYGFSNASQNVTIYPAAPVANFTIDHNIGSNPLTVQFTDTSGVGITSWFWNFDDGGTSNLQNPSHTYLTLGTYHAQLTVGSSVGTNVSQPVTIYVVNSAIPISDFSGAPTTGSAPLSTQFTDLSVALGGINAWNWSFGDGNYSNVQNPVHIYSSGGQYTVMLTATSGAFSNYTVKVGYINIGVPSSSVYANYTANETYAANYPATIQFYDTSVCNPVCTNWAWDLNGDGATDSMAQNPVYTYTYPGNYSPRLVVSNGINAGTKIRNLYIVIGPILVHPTIPQPTNAWVPGYQYNGSIWEFKGTSYVDLPNSTFLKYWLQNFSATGNFSVYGFATGLMAPLMHVFGFWIFLIVWGLYLFAVWIRSQDVTLPLIIGILSMGTFGLLFPKESLPVIIIMFVICGGIIITKLMKDSI